MMDKYSATPLHVLASRTEETKKGLKAAEWTQSLRGVAHDYTADPSPLDTPKRFSEIVLDTTLLEVAHAQGIQLWDLLENMDPTEQYSGPEPGNAQLAEMDAFTRQMYRYGLLPDVPRGLGNLPMAYASANTVANTILLPSYMNRTMFWWPQIDMDYDPNALLAGTRTQVDRTWRQVVIDDSQYGNRYLLEISEMSSVPATTFSEAGYSGSTKKHGMSWWFSREFATRVPFNVIMKCVDRSKLRERRQYFDHIISVIMSGDAVYGLASGMTPVTATSLDNVGCVATGDISFLAWSLFLFGMRPYNPTISVMNINTAHKMIAANPPANMIAYEEFKMLVQERKYPDMPSFLNQSLLGSAPPALIVPTTALADNYIICMNVPNSLMRVVLTDGEINEQAYDPEKQTYKYISTMQSGLQPLPDFKNAATKVLSLIV